MRIVKVDPSCKETAAILTKFQAETFPGDRALSLTCGWWWVVWDGPDPIAFAALRPVLSWTGAVYLARCGVLPSHRGQGLQRKLIATRERYAKKLGMAHAITTTLNNPTSANNLISRKYRTYEPTTRWGAKETIYWVKDLA